MKTSSTAGFVLATVTVLVINAASSVYLYNNLIRLHRTGALVISPDPEPVVMKVEITTDAGQANIVTRTNSVIQPPIPELEPVAQNIYLQSHAGTTYISRNKTRVEVPAFAFTDVEGNAIDADVEIQFREFRRPYDIFLSGIPVWTDSNQLLSSPVLFELRASSYGAPVYIDPFHPVKIIPGTNADSMSVFHFSNDEKWIEQFPDTTNGFVFNDNISIQPEEIKKKYGIAFKCMTSMEGSREHFLGRKKFPDHFIFIIQDFALLRPELKELTDVHWICETNAIENYRLLFGDNSQATNAERILICDSVKILPRDSVFVFRIVHGETNLEIPVKPFIVNARDELSFQLAYNAYLSACLENQNPDDEMTSLHPSLRTGEQYLEIIADSLGIWSAGKKIAAEFSNRVNAIFIDVAGRKIDVRKGWMLTNQSALVSITDFSKFDFNRSSNIFWTVLPGNRIGIVYPNEFKRKRLVSEIVKIKMYVFENNRVLPRIL